MDSSKDIVSEINVDRAHDPRVICEENGILQLNVGGQYFSTTRETLSAAGHSFFSGLISGSFGILRDSKGCVFIDRDRKSMNCNYDLAPKSQVVVFIIHFDVVFSSYLTSTIFSYLLNVRTAKLFRYVLNFLRSQCTSLAVETDSRAKLRAILIEAEFFQVVLMLRNYLIQGSNFTVSFLSGFTVDRTHSAATWRTCETGA
jgi:hypothetical protein